MSTEKTNSEALCALENGDFALAQKLLRENIKTGDHRAINNLGIFYIENGMIRKDGKNISAVSYGIKYIKQAYKSNKSELVLLNMAMISAQFDGDYKKAAELYALAYDLGKNKDALYNLCACFYMISDYDSVLSRMKISDASKQDEFLLYGFALLAVDPERFSHWMEKCDLNCRDIENDDAIQLLYFSQKNQITLSRIYNYLDEWHPDEYMWAMVIDLLDEYRVSYAEIENIIKQNTDGIFNGSATRKAAFDFLNDPLNRKKFIASESKHHFVPPLRHTCGYFGCPAHQTRWAQ